MQSLVWSQIEEIQNYAGLQTMGDPSSIFHTELIISTLPIVQIQMTIYCLHVHRDSQMQSLFTMLIDMPTALNHIFYDNLLSSL